MKIRIEKQEHLQDTQIPNIFIKEYMPVLTDLSTKVYLYIRMLSEMENSLSKADMVAVFDIDLESLNATLLELASHSLIEFSDSGILVCDIVEREVKKRYKSDGVQAPVLNNNNNLTQRQKVISDINKTFFSGVMSPSWYSEIDSWFEDYSFDPQVIYALFNECARRGKLNSKAYIAQVARNWNKSGIVNYNDLNAYFLAFDKTSKLSKLIGSKLKKKITQYDEDIITSWVHKMGYEFDVIEIAIRKTARLANPNLEYANKLLEEWFSKSLKTPQDVKEYEEIKKKKYFSKNSNDNKKAKNNVANFQQREYSEDYMDSLIEDVTAHTDSKN